MHLVHILLPIRDNAGAAYPESLHAGIRRELTERFGGLTAFSRAPAQGFWKDGEATTRDDIIVLEVLVEDLDPEWWRGYRASLEAALRQEVVVVRAHAVTLL